MNNKLKYKCCISFDKIFTAVAKHVLNVIIINLPTFLINLLFNSISIVLKAITLISIHISCDLSQAFDSIAYNELLCKHNHNFLKIFIKLLKVNCGK